MIAIFNDNNERLPITYNSDLVINEPIAGNKQHLYEVNVVLVRDVFSGINEPRPTGDGTEAFSVRKAAKLIRIDGIIRAPTLAALSDMNARLRTEFDPSLLAKNDLTGHGFAPLEFTVLAAAGNQESYVLTRPVANPDYLFDQYLGKNAPFRLELFCSDPRRYLQTATATPFTGSQSLVITNTGNYPSIPTISITMSGVGSDNYGLLNTLYDPDGSVRMDLTGMVNGDVIRVYPDEKIVTRNGIRYDHIVANTTNWNLMVQPGAQTFQVTSGTNAITTLTTHHAFSM
jgi:hypothetical protein